MSVDQPTDLDHLLERCGFDPARLEAQRRALEAHGLAGGAAVLAGEIRSIGAQDLIPVAATAEDADRGREAIARGAVAVLLLNGGMATRFGGIAKGAARCLGERSFLDLRLSQVAGVCRELGARVPVLLMSSFATDEATRAHLEQHRRFGLPEEDVVSFLQGISLRLTPEGALFRDDAGRPSPYAPGHGDLPWALERSGAAAALRGRGVETVFVSNVDNVGCSLDPAVLGAHLRTGAPMSAEIVERLPGDTGGGPARWNGRPVLVEGFRLPRGFDAAGLLGFNTNTFYLGWEALRPDRELAFHAVAKEVAGRRAVQFERILGEISHQLPCSFLGLGRDPERGRFLPVKTPEDLEALQPVLRRRYGA